MSEIRLEVISSTVASNRFFKNSGTGMSSVHNWYFCVRHIINGSLVFILPAVFFPLPPDMNVCESQAIFLFANT